MKKLLSTLPLMMSAGLAQAHVDHAEHMRLMDGLVHPIGFDHLLAMLAVGLWSARAFKNRAAWLPMLAFVSSMVLGALLAHATGGGFTLAEQLISISVVALAGLVVMPNASKTIGFSLILSAGLVHGWTHGAEATQGGVFLMYMTGLVLTTVALHVTGVLAGIQLSRLKNQMWSWRTISTAVAAYGIYAFSLAMYN